MYVMDRLSHAPGVPGLFAGCLLAGTLRLALINQYYMIRDNSIIVSIN